MKKGWINFDRFQSKRHSLASLGIKTGRKTYSKVGTGVISLKNNGMFFPNQKLNYKVMSSSEFRIDDNITIVARSEDTRSGFRHIADLYKDGTLIESAKATYLNRTWEKYEFESVISKLLDEAGYKDTGKEKMMATVEGKALGRTDEMFKTIGTVASLGEVFGKTDKEKNAWKLRMIKAGLGSKGFQEPENWDTLSEKVKGERLDKVIKFMKEKKPLDYPKKILSVPEKHQLKVAKGTMKMPKEILGVIGGMTKKEAQNVIKRLGYSKGKLTGEKIVFKTNKQAGDYFKKISSITGVLSTHTYKLAGKIVQRLPKQKWQLPYSKKKVDFFRDSAGKISDKMLSPYGKGKLKLLDGAQLVFTDSTVTVQGNKLVNKAGKTIQKIDNDRLVNKIIFKVI